MRLQDFSNQHNIVDLSFFNFRNAITACYFANKGLQVLKVNDNFKSFFPVLGNVTNAYFPDVLEQLGVPGAQIEDFITSPNGKGSVLIPEIHIHCNGEDRVYSLLSTRTTDNAFFYLNGVQGQFVDRTAEWKLRKEREDLLDQKIRDREIIEEKGRQLQSLATRLAKHLSPQIYEIIFSHTDEQSSAYTRKDLTIFLSDIVQFTDLSDTLEPEGLAKVVNSYLSEMASIALECGGTIDKFIGDAILIFFGDPQSQGETEDDLRCVEMALRMRARAAELQKYWQKLGVSRLDYTVLGSPVNLASRLENAAKPDANLVDGNTHNLIRGHVHCEPVDQITPKGFARPVQVYQVDDFFSEEHRTQRRRLSRIGQRVEVNVIDSSDIRAAIEELRRFQLEFERQFGESLKNAETGARKGQAMQSGQKC